MARLKPTMRAPASAPPTLPRPPITTTAKARTITSTPIPGATEIAGAVTAPAMQPSTEPMTKVRRK